MPGLLNRGMEMKLVWNALRTTLVCAIFLGVFAMTSKAAPADQPSPTDKFKNLEFREQMRLELRLESFNAFNHTQWGGPDHNIASPQFGQITSARPGRINQVGMKFVF